jgi:hypothetical protein
MYSGKIAVPPGGGGRVNREKRNHIILGENIIQQYTKQHH